MSAEKHDLIKQEPVVGPDEGRSPWEELRGQQVVVDVASPFVYLGTLVGEQSGYLVLDEADAHDLRDTSTNRERYVIDVRLHGVQPNRRRVWINLAEVVAISRLDDIIGH